MLDNRLGVQFLFMAGETIPRVCPPEVLSSLIRAEITRDSTGVDGFQLSFAVGANGGGVEVQSRVLDTLNRVWMGISTGGIPEVLLDGVITQHDASPDPGSGGTVLTVTGRDVSLYMDLVEKNAPFENQSDSVIVGQILGRYSQVGFVPKVTSTGPAPSVNERIPRQAESDYRYVQRLAQRNGFVFYVEPQSFGVNEAYFGPDKRGGRHSTLLWSTSPRRNVTSLRASLDGLAPIDVESFHLDLNAKQARKIPPTTENDPGLSASPLAAKRKVLLRSAASLPEGLVATTAAALIARAAEPVGIDGSLDFVRYGEILRPRAIVDVQGAGPTYDGEYYVRRVTHVIEKGAYTQNFTLGREGTGARGKAGFG